MSFLYQMDKILICMDYFIIFSEKLKFYAV